MPKQNRSSILSLTLVAAGGLAACGVSSGDPGAAPPAPETVTVTSGTTSSKAEPLSTSSVPGGQTSVEPSQAVQTSSGNAGGVSRGQQREAPAAAGPSEATQGGQPKECGVNDVHLTSALAGTEPDTGEATVRVTARNVTDQPCLLLGYPKVEMTKQGSGSTLGGPAKHDPKGGAESVVLKPQGANAGHVDVLVKGADPNCATPAAGLRLWLPGEPSKALFTTVDRLVACSDPTQKQMRVRTFANG